MINQTIQGKYAGKKVVITGGSSGFGLTAAQLLVDEGACVLITGRTQNTLTVAQEQLGEGATAVRSDAASLADIEALAERTKAEFGTVDALLANTGSIEFASFEDTDENLLEEMLSVNAKGPYFTVQALAPMLTEGSGVVFTTAASSMLGFSGISAGAAAKAALRSMTRSLARELIPHHVRVNAVSPGPIDSGILEKSMSQEAAERAKARMAADNPMLRVGTSVEVAKAMLFLAFDATYTTGAELAVDGGLSQL